MIPELKIAQLESLVANLENQLDNFVNWRKKIFDLVDNETELVSFLKQERENYWEFEEFMKQSNRQTGKE